MRVTEQVLLEAIVQEVRGLRRDLRSHRSNKHMLSGKERQALRELWSKRFDMLYAEREFVENIKDLKSITPRQYFWFLDLCEEYGVEV